MSEKQWHIFAAGWLLIGLLSMIFLNQAIWAATALACAVSSIVGAEVAQLRQELRDSHPRPLKITVNGQPATYGATLRAWQNLHEGGREAPGANQHEGGYQA